MLSKLTSREALLGVVGVAAFVVGGIVARAKAIETVEIVENFFSKDETPPANSSAE